ncbi:hypothetical protein PIB30_048295 [Stylosanthes scabra]|uniref:Uncharacterized protein n=1 Tax=Stylosanthes scabra TaxID=79078 RepID=A0ABU6VJZ3_9FABA|nr:hypothetical protein [Stylosanthes scabra]
MEFYVEVRQVGGSSGFCPFVPAVGPAPINIVELNYNSGEDSDYEEESPYHSTEEDEAVPNTPTLGGTRLVLPALLLIPGLTEVPSIFQQLDPDTRHVEDTTMESVAIEYNTDGGLEFIVGHRMEVRKIGGPTLVWPPSWQKIILS